MPRRHVHEELFDVPPDRLFAALHTPSDIRGWWGAARAIVLAEKDGWWAATWGGLENAPDYTTIARMSAFEAPRRMVLADYRSKSKDGPLPFQARFETEFLVERRPNGASLRVTQSGFPDESIADSFFAACERGWRETFTGLRRHLGG